MKTRHNVFLVWVLISLLLAAAGCSDDQDNTINESPGTAVDDYENIDLSQTYGGLTATDEDDAFGQADLILEAAADDQDNFADTWAEDEDVLEYEDRAQRPDTPGGPARARFTYLRIKWGQLGAEPDTLDGEALDWTGQLNVDRGIVVVKRVIRFERPYDHVVIPRLDRRTVNWVSHTGPHYDGILVQIIEPPADPTAEDDEPNYLHFLTGELEQSFLVSELAQMDQIIEVDDIGNGVHFCGFEMTEISLCPRGFLSARWAPISGTEPDSNGNTRLGYFHGRWVGLHGHLQGFIRGAYGLNSDDERVFIGKYISRSGLFRGFLRGTWEPAAEDNSTWAEFHGHWIGASEIVEGVLRGRCYNVSGREGGFLEGRWATSCDEEGVAALQ